MESIFGFHALIGCDTRTISSFSGISEKICRKWYLDMRGSRNFRQGGPGQSDKKGLTTFFLVLSLLYRSQFQRKLLFFKDPEGVQHFSRGVQLFPGGGGGPIAYSL